MSDGETSLSFRRLWIALALVVGLSFGALLYFGGEVYQYAPPIPSRVVTERGEPLFTGEQILAGQDVWRSIGGQELGSIWGHGAYTAPDWTADWIHREAMWLLEELGRADGVPYAAADEARKAGLQVTLQEQLRTNTYDADSGTVTVSVLRARAIRAVQEHYLGLFGAEPELAGLREAYAMPADTVPDAAHRQDLTAFFFWAAWACVTERPGQDYTYTNNWPPDALVGNRPTAHVVLVSVLSFVLLLGGIGALVWFYAATRERWTSEQVAPAGSDPWLAVTATPSMQAAAKYFWLVGALLVLQMIAGMVTAHYGVEGTALYGIPIARWFPYSLSRTWHVQLGLFWIATAWLATGLCLAPLIAGREPRWQRFGVNLLFAALLVVVAGSMVGQGMAIHQQLSPRLNFWFGHQGFEYLDLGRLWQALLFVGLLLWLVLMLRTMVPALRQASGVNRQLLLIFALSAAAIALFYGAGFMWGRDTNLAIAEYWRWWVVHLWVEGFFEVFAVAIVAFAFSRLNLVRVRSATMAVLFTTILYLAGGVLGTFHHLYFSGTTPAIIAVGGTFSALEIVPLVVIGYEAYDNWKLVRLTSWTEHYEWPVYFLVAVAFWNLVGAGLFGFLINPPIALYYMQGLNTTPVHAHAALFGVYGMLGLALLLLSMRVLTVRTEWRTGVLCFAFWAMNIGLTLMVSISLLPIGLAQTWASIEHGMWYARSAEFLAQPPLQTLRWLRVVGDVVFAAGMLAMGWFVVGLSTGWSTKGRRQDAPNTDSTAHVRNAPT